MSLRGLHHEQAAVPVNQAGQAEPCGSVYLVGEGAAMRRVRSQLQRIAPYFRMALVTGEEGTGKETVARELHAHSPGADGPFVTWEAVRFAETLVSGMQGSELLQQAHRGTLFLREIGGVPLSLQQPLLRLLQHQEMRSQRLDVRIVVSSERELRTLTTIGQLREDLHRQVATVDIGLCPLRKRQEDIGPIAEVVLGSTGHQGLHREALARLESHTWPANVRELRQVVEQGKIAAEGAMVEARHLQLPQHREETVPEETLERLHDVVQRHVLDVLAKCSGNKLRASEALGISRSTLYRMLDACSTGADVRYP